MNSSIHLYTVYTRNIATVNQQQRLLHFSKGLGHYSELSLWLVHSLPFDIPRLLLMSMENVPRMVNPLCASIPRGIDIHGKAVHGHSYTVRRYNATPLIPVQSTRPGCSPLETRTATDADSVFTGALNNSLSVLVPPFTRTISSQRELRHESPREHLFARRPRNSRRFSTSSSDTPD